MDRKNNIGLVKDTSRFTPHALRSFSRFTPHASRSLCPSHFTLHSLRSLLRFTVHASRSLCPSRFTLHGIKRFTPYASLFTVFIFLTLLFTLYSLRSSSFAADKLVVKDLNGTNTVFKVDDTGAITAAGNFYWDPATGRFGAGTSSPTSNLEALGSTFPVIKGTRTSTSGTAASSAMGVVLQKTNTPNPSAGFGPGFILQGVNSTGIINNFGAVYGANEAWSDLGTTQSKGGIRLAVFNTSSSPTYVISALSNGNVGIGPGMTAPLYPLHIFNGAYVTLGGHWTDASSRDYKENINTLTIEEALSALVELNPVKYNYKVDADEKHVGFIAEDVPALLATKDRKGLSPMDIVAVLTKVVQAQQKTIADLQGQINKINSKGIYSQIQE